MSWPKYVQVVKEFTSNRASASMTIRDIVRELDSSLIINDSHEHEPSGCIPDGQKLVCRFSSKPERSLSQICEAIYKVIQAVKMKILLSLASIPHYLLKQQQSVRKIK